MSDNDLTRLAHLCTVIDHLELHGRHAEIEKLAKERDALLAPKSQPQPKGRK